MNSRSLPTVSIVTPCLNQAQFLEATIRSVLSQDYPDIEYIVMDGGSTDGSLEILRRYDGSLRYWSAADNGQADAINRGFQLSSGEIFAFLNADDVYLPGAVATAVQALSLDPSAAAVCGKAYLMDGSGQRVGSFATGKPDLEGLRRECVICQPAVFLRREAFREVGLLNPLLHFALDYDLWIRLARSQKFRRVDSHLAAARVHPAAKTFSCRREALREAIEVLRSHFGYAPFQWVYEYSCDLWRIPFRFQEPPPRSAIAWALSVAMGSYWNSRQLFRYWGDCGRIALSGWRHYLADYHQRIPRSWQEAKCQLYRKSRSGPIKARSAATDATKADDLIAEQVGG
jgi:glycosyltransferase involved in cell wall biosynthesis